MHETRKLLSIIVPAYNMEAYLPRCLDSLLIPNQTLLETLEVIVVNDGSSDRTSAMAHAYAEKYPGAFRVIDKPNGHYGSCINAALPQTSGLFVKVLDADDFVDPACLHTFLEQLTQEAEAETPVDVVITDWETVNPEGACVASKPYHFLPSGVFSMETLNRLRDPHPHFMGVHALTYRKALFDRFVYHQTEGCSYSDTEWYSIPMAYAERIRYLPLCLTKYLVGRDGQSVDLKNYARDFHILADFAFGIIHQHAAFDERTTEAGRTYVARRIVDLLGWIYGGALLGLGTYKANIDLKAFDLKLKAESPRFYEAAFALKSPSRRFDYHYVKDWRRNYSTKTLKRRCYTLYVMLYDALWKIIRGTKKCDS